MDSPKAKILVVDDEPSVLVTVKAILEGDGYGVDALPGGVAALDAIRTRNYDLVLTDLKMPEVDGLAVLAEVRKSSPTTVTVMMTGYGSIDTAMEALQLGAYEYLLKPTEVPQLKLAVRRSLERKRLSEIDTLYRVSQALTSRPEAAAMAGEVADAARSVLNLHDATLVVCRAEAPPNATALEKLICENDLKARLAAGEIITLANESPALTAWAAREGVVSFALVPGIARGRLICVLAAHNGAQPYEFHVSACRFLRALAEQSALALENVQLIDELRQNNQQLEEANQKLRELDRLKSQFLSVATHELRTPLTVILGYNSMIAESLGERLNDEERETLRESVAACKRLIRLVNSMLDISQIESGRMQLNFAPVDLRQLVNGAVMLFQNDARHRNLHLVAELPTRLPRVKVDGERIQQVLVNLIGNALRFTPPGGRITVRLRHRPEAQTVELAVVDTGVGMSAEDQARILDESAPARRSADGAGLGLAISRRIVQGHDGRLEVESIPERGSTFRVVLPVGRGAGRALNAVSA